MALIASGGFSHDPADINSVVHLTQYQIDLAYFIALASAGLFGTSVTIVVAISSNEDAGAYASGLSDFFYHRIWVIPKHIDLGNITANQEREVELWNAHFTSKELDEYTVDGDITVDGFASGVMPPLESEIYIVTITLAGAPTLDATITYFFLDAEVESIEATFFGRRVIPFGLRHNWIDPVLEQISFKTDVLLPESGREQRIGLRQVPRRRIELSYLTLTPQERAYMENFLYGWQARSYAVPLWQDKTTLRTEALAGTLVFDVDTTTRDFEPGGLVYITDNANTDTLEIESVTDDSITTVTPSLFDHPEHAKVVPARVGMLDSRFTHARHTTHHDSVRLSWNLLADQDSTTRRETYEPELYRGVEVYNISNDYSSDLTIDQAMAEQMLDAEIGIFNKYSDAPYPRRSYPFNNLITREELPQFIEWIYNRRGQLKPFWFVERTPAFFLQADSSADDENLNIKGFGYNDFVNDSEARRDVAILTSAGWKYRRISVSDVDEDGTETITLDSALGVALTVAEEPLICYLKFVRLASDTVELSYETTDAIKTAMSFIDLQTNYNES